MHEPSDTELDALGPPVLANPEGVLHFEFVPADGRPPVKDKITITARDPVLLKKACALIECLISDADPGCREWRKKAQQLMELEEWAPGFEPKSIVIGARG